MTAECGSVAARRRAGRLFSDLWSFAGSSWERACHPASLPETWKPLVFAQPGGGSRRASSVRERISSFLYTCVSADSTV